MDKEIQNRNTYFQWIFALLTNFTLLTFGMECGWISPTMKILQSEASPTGYPLSDNMMSWIASSMTISTVFGASLYSYIADAYGRKIGIICIVIPQAISWILKLIYSSCTTIIIARLFAGLAGGGCFNVVPMYVKEISQDDMRGIFGTLPFLLQNVGILIMYIMGAYLKYFTVICIVLVVPVITCILLIKAPESPEFLIKRGKIDEAIQTVAFLRGLEKENKIVQRLIDDMKKEKEYFQTLPSPSISSILKEESWRRGVILILFSFIIYSLNGAYAIITFASTILISTGIKFETSPEIQTLSFPIILIISNLALATTVEKIGRKPLLMGTYLTTACSMSAIAVMMIMQGHGTTVPSWLPVLAMMSAIAMYGAGVSTLPYIIMTEMFSFQIRAKVMGLVITISSIVTFLLVAIYTPMSNGFGSFSPFIFYAAVNFAGFIFTTIYIPETKDKSEEEILRILTKKKEFPTYFND